MKRERYQERIRGGQARRHGDQKMGPPLCKTGGRTHHQAVFLPAASRCRVSERPCRNIFFYPAPEMTAGRRHKGTWLAPGPRVTFTDARVEIAQRSRNRRASKQPIHMQAISRARSSLTASSARGARLQRRRPFCFRRVLLRITSAARYKKVFKKRSRLKKKIQFLCFCFLAPFSPIIFFPRRTTKSIFTRATCTIKIVVWASWNQTGT